MQLGVELVFLCHIYKLFTCQFEAHIYQRINYRYLSTTDIYGRMYTYTMSKQLSLKSYHQTHIDHTHIIIEKLSPHLLINKLSSHIYTVFSLKIHHQLHILIEKVSSVTHWKAITQYTLSLKSYHPAHILISLSPL